VPARRASPALIWSLVVVVSLVLLGGSFVYAAQVGDPTVREDAQRRGSRPRNVTTSTVPGSFGGIGGGGVGSPPLDPSTGSGSGSGAGSGTFGFTPADFERVLPPATCVRVIEELVTPSAPTLDEVADAWRFVQTCASSQGRSGLPPVEMVTSDPLGQQCLAVVLARTTLAYRSPTVPLTALDQLLSDCQAQGVVPAVPGFTSPLPASPSAPSPSSAVSVPRTGGS
jgi:hypothetical protein